MLPKPPNGDRQQRSQHCVKQSGQNAGGEPQLDKSPYSSSLTVEQPTSDRQTTLDQDQLHQTGNKAEKNQLLVSDALVTRQLPTNQPGQ